MNKRLKLDELETNNNVNYTSVKDQQKDQHINQHEYELYNNDYYNSDQYVDEKSKECVDEKVKKIIENIEQEKIEEQEEHKFECKEEFHSIDKVETTSLAITTRKRAAEIQVYEDDNVPDAEDYRTYSLIIFNVEKKKVMGERRGNNKVEMEMCRVVIPNERIDDEERRLLEKLARVPTIDGHLWEQFCWRFDKLKFSTARPKHVQPKWQKFLKTAEHSRSGYKIIDHYYLF